MAASMEIGNVYPTRVFLRIKGLTAYYAYARKFTWYYRVDGTTTWTLVPNGVSSLPVKSASTVSPWLKIKEGTLDDYTRYNFKCVVTYTGNDDVYKYYKTVRTGQDIFNVGHPININPNVFTLLPKSVASIRNVSKIRVLYASDGDTTEVRRGNVWKLLDTANVSELGSKYFRLAKSYVNYDLKVIMLSKTNELINIVFVELD